jgi:hypothetical protein
VTVIIIIEISTGNSLFLFSFIVISCLSARIPLEDDLSYISYFPIIANLIDLVLYLISHPEAIAATTQTAGAKIKCNLTIAHEKYAEQIV